MIETIALLLRVGELLVEFKVVENRDPTNVHDLLIASVQGDGALGDASKRRELQHRRLPKHTTHAVHEIRHIEELDIPARHDIGIVPFPSPIRKELCEQRRFIFAVMIGDALLRSVRSCPIHHDTRLAAMTPLDGDCRHFLKRIIRRGECFVGCGFDVEVPDIQTIHIGKNLGIPVGIRERHVFALNVAIRVGMLLKKVASLVEAVAEMRKQRRAIECRLAGVFSCREIVGGLILQFDEVRLTLGVPCANIDTGADGRGEGILKRGVGRVLNNWTKR